ncbi:hypothetical protein [uncultured Tateyamaria sp.]|uniref:hypothetical protein n=1 Tax=uncultured Tateyamaria sp. TaxID=455651 RepID=UPI00262D2D2E|nr:hypothetical protein [uncultured Tateyamaria sp.]
MARDVGPVQIRDAECVGADTDLCTERPVHLISTDPLGLIRPGSGSSVVAEYLR